MSLEEFAEYVISLVDVEFREFKVYWQQKNLGSEEKGHILVLRECESDFWEKVPDPEYIQNIHDIVDIYGEARKKFLSNLSSEVDTLKRMALEEFVRTILFLLNKDLEKVKGISKEKDFLVELRWIETSDCMFFLDPIGMMLIDEPELSYLVELYFRTKKESLVFRF